MSNAFCPAATVNIDVSSSNQRVQIADNLTTVRIMNDGTATAWIAFGDSAVAATVAAGLPVGSGVTEVLTPPNYGGGPLYAAAIAAGSTGKIYFTRGGGI